MPQYEVSIEYSLTVEAESEEEAVALVKAMRNQRQIDYSQLIPVIGDYVMEIEDDD